MNKNAYKSLMEQVCPSPELIAKTKLEMARAQLRTTQKEEPFMKKRALRTVLIAVIALIALTSTALAALHFLRAEEVAEELENPTLGQALLGDAAVRLDQSATSGDYTFTLMAVVSGSDISDGVFTSDDTIQDDRTYAVLAIARTDGTALTMDSPDRFLASLLVKGQKPWQLNIFTMNGAHSETTIDGILYRIVECDNMAMFADRGLYFAVTTDQFINNQSFLYDEASGVISLNPANGAASAIFDLPLDPALADPAKAQAYLDELFAPPPAEHEPAPVREDDGINWDEAAPVEGTLQELTLDADGMLTYTYETEAYGGGSITVLASAHFADSPAAQSAIVSHMMSEGEDGTATHYAVRVTRDDSGNYTGMIVVPQE